MDNKAKQVIEIFEQLTKTFDLYIIDETRLALSSHDDFYIGRCSAFKHSRELIQDHLVTVKKELKTQQ